MAKMENILPQDLTHEISDRLKSIRGQMDGLIRMLELGEDPDQILLQFKAAEKGLDKAHFLLLDDVYRKALARKIVETMAACPGNCGNEDKIEYIRAQFPSFTLDELTQKMKEIWRLDEKLKQDKISSRKESD
ncbi:MAG: metal-sensitive transcriptional regulator [Chitinophagaceae bacterium]